MKSSSKPARKSLSKSPEPSPSAGERLAPAKRFPVLVSLVTMLLATAAACGPAPVPAPPRVLQNATLNAAPVVPVVKIKVRRSVAGKYSWDLGGEDVDAIVRADSILRKTLGPEAQ